MWNLMPEVIPTITYQTWRLTNNPWEDNFFIGDLDPVEDKALIDEVHNIIDDYYAPRYLGVQDEDRFTTLFRRELLIIENKFFKSIKLDNYYPELKDILSNMELINDSIHEGTGSVTSNDTITHNTTDTRTDEYGAQGSNTTDTYNVTDDGNIVHGKVTSTESTNYGKTENTETNTNGTGNSRALLSDTPQSNVADTTSGLDTPVKWTYATSLQDNLNKSNSSGTNKLTNSGTDTTTSETETYTDNTTNTKTGTVQQDTSIDEHTDTSTFTKSGTTKNDGTKSTTQNTTDNETLNGRNIPISELIKNFEDLCYRTISPYMYLFKSIDLLFFSVWDDNIF